MRVTSKETQGNGRRSTVANSSVTQTAAAADAADAADAALHSGLQHSRLALGPCLGGAFKHSDVLCSARRRRRREKNNSSSVPVCPWRTSPHVCVGGSPLSGRIKGRNVFELFPSPPAVSPTHPPPYPKGSNAWPGLYTIHKDHSVGEKWSHYFTSANGMYLFSVPECGAVVASLCFSRTHLHARTFSQCVARGRWEACLAAALDVWESLKSPEGNQSVERAAQNCCSGFIYMWD